MTEGREVYFTIIFSVSLVVAETLNVFSGQQGHQTLCDQEGVCDLVTAVLQLLVRLGRSCEAGVQRVSLLLITDGTDVHACSCSH